MKNKTTIFLCFMVFIATFTYIFLPKQSKILINDITKLDITKNIVPKNLKGLNEKNLININTADIGLLKTLPNIGDAIAKNIIYYRENISKFSSISDIKNVSRIGDKTYEKIKNLITIN